MQSPVSRPSADIDPRLLHEALRRALASRANAGVDPEQLHAAIIAEAHRGARDLYSLVRAAERAARRWAA